MVVLVAADGFAGGAVSVGPALHGGPGDLEASGDLADRPPILDHQSGHDQAMTWSERSVGTHDYSVVLMRCRMSWQISASAATAAAEPQSTAGVACAATSSEPKVAPSADPR